MPTPFIEVPLKSYTLRFRALSWLEESRLKFPPKEDQRVTVLAHALHDISGLTISSEVEARRVFTSIPLPARSTVWMLYRGNLPEDRAFATGGDLYTAPESAVFNKRLIEDEAVPGEGADIAQMRGQFGNEAADDARELQQAMLRNAAKSGNLRRVESQ